MSTTLVTSDVSVSSFYKNLISTGYESPDILVQSYRTLVVDTNNYENIFPTLLNYSWLFPEFEIIDFTSDIYTLRRKSYNMDLFTCCTTNTLYNIDNVGVLSTCDPTTKEFTASTCDNTMQTFCMYNNITIPKCLSWLYNYTRRLNIPIESMTQYCTTNDNIFTPACAVYINGLRANELNPIADNILSVNYNNNYDNRLNCSFNNIQTNYTTPKVCWSYDCINTPTYLLKYNDIVLRNNCSIYQCNIDISSATIDNKVYVNLDCNNSLNNTNNYTLMSMALNENRKNRIDIFKLLVLPFLIFIFFG